MATKKTTTKTPKPKAVKAPAKDAVALEAAVYSAAGKQVSTIQLPAELFGAPWRADLVHQVTTAMQANLRQNRAHTKDRAEVSGGGKKPWKQKGTGQARHGSSRSPLWRHGGVTFGPRSERDYSEKINRKMRSQALISVLSRKAKDGELVFVDSFSFAAPKTKEAVQMLAKISKASGTRLLSLNKRSNPTLVALVKHEPHAIKSFRNISGVATEEIRNLNPLEILSHRYLVLEQPEAAFAALVARVKAA